MVCKLNEFLFKLNEFFWESQDLIFYPSIESKKKLQTSSGEAYNCFLA